MSETCPLEKKGICREAPVALSTPVSSHESGGICEPTEGSSAVSNASLTAVSQAQQDLRQTVKATKEGLKLGVFAHRGFQSVNDPSLFICADPRTPGAAAILSAQYASPDAELRAAALESLKGSDLLNQCFDPRYEENEVFIVAQRLSVQDSDQVSEGDQALKYLVSINPEVRERIDTLVRELEEIDGDFERRAAADLREVLQAPDPENVSIAPKVEASHSDSTSTEGQVVSSVPPDRIDVSAGDRELVSIRLTERGLMDRDSPPKAPFAVRGRLLETLAVQVDARESSKPSTLSLSPSGRTALLGGLAPSSEVFLTSTTHPLVVRYFQEVAQGRDPLPTFSREGNPFVRFFNSIPTDQEGRVLLAKGVLRLLASVVDPIAPPRGSSFQPLYTLRIRCDYDPGHRKVEISIVPVTRAIRRRVGLIPRRPDSRRGTQRWAFRVEREPSLGQLPNGPVFAPPPMILAVEKKEPKAVIARGSGSTGRNSPPVAGKDRSHHRGDRNGGHSGGNPEGDRQPGDDPQDEKES